MSDPLQKLWELVDASMVQDKPELDAEIPAFQGTPRDNEYEHPVIQQRNQVDALRKKGVSPEDAHQQIYGDIDLADTESKRALASTFGRVQDDGNKKGIKIEKDGEFLSLLAVDDEMEKNLDKVTADDLRTPAAQEIPDALQDPDKPQLAQEEEYDYNMDVQYLQTYGRA